MSMKQIAIATVGVMLGNVIAERFLLKASPDDPQGFVMVTDGIGLDEIVRGAAAVAGIALAKKTLGGIL